ncbi:MAG TPA: hypothetical protein VH372_18670 [Actinospica sp.]|nr:hypothetical protein [Actinospica sp.]
MRHAALALRELLDDLGLPNLVKTTGGRGLHVSVPVLRRYDADELRDFARNVSAVLVSREPDRGTSEIRKNKSPSDWRNPPASPAPSTTWSTTRSSKHCCSYAPERSCTAPDTPRYAPSAAWRSSSQVAFTVGAASIAGIPPFNGYVSLSLIHQGLTDSHQYTPTP